MAAFFQDIGRAFDAAGEVVGQQLRGLRNGIEVMGVIGESTALGKMSQASISNIGYIATENPTPRQVVDSRSLFLEAGLISCACCVHKFVMSLVWGIAALINSGTNAELNTLAKRSILHLGISVASMGISLVGLCSPEYGASATSNLVNMLFTQRNEIAAFLNPPADPQ